MKQLDTIFLKDITLPCTIGVSDFERKEKQLVKVNIELSVDVRKPGKSDDLSDTVNCKPVYKDIVAIMDTSHFFLLEALAEAIATVCLKDKRVKQTKVRVEKLKWIRLAGSMGVEIVRTNDQEKS